MNASKPDGGRSRRWWRLLLLVPVVATLWVPWFSYARPTLLGVPFFYWYLMAWVPIGAACTATVYFKTRDLI